MLTDGRPTVEAAYAEAPGHGVHHSQGRKLDPSAPHRVSVAPAKPFRVAANV